MVKTTSMVGTVMNGRNGGRNKTAKEKRRKNPTATRKTTAGVLQSRMTTHQMMEAAARLTAVTPRGVD